METATYYAQSNDWIHHQHHLDSLNIPQNQHHLDKLGYYQILGLKGKEAFASFKVMNSFLY